MYSLSGRGCLTRSQDRMRPVPLAAAAAAGLAVSATARCTCGFATHGIPRATQQAYWQPLASTRMPQAPAAAPRRAALRPLHCGSSSSSGSESGGSRSSSAAAAQADDDAELAAALASGAAGSAEQQREFYLSRQQYSLREFWDAFYTPDEEGESEAGDSYDWFLGYSKMKDALEAHAAQARGGRGTALILGCGNSELSERMYADGWTRQLNIDFSAPVIETMRTKHAGAPGMEWAVMDARDLVGVEEGSVAVAVDKGLVDAISHSDAYREDITQVVSECARVLQPGGCYMCASFKTPESLLPLLSNEAWEGNAAESKGNLTPTVLLYVARKRQQPPK